MVGQYGNVKALATRNAIYGGGRLGIPACDSALRPLRLGFLGSCEQRLLQAGGADDRWVAPGTCNLLCRVGFDGVDVRSNRISQKDLRGFGRGRGAKKGPSNAISKVCGFTRHLPFLRFVCERAESDCGRGPGLCWPSARMCLRLL
jgi:hypothetical protein